MRSGTGELTAVETGQRVLAFEARAQSDGFTKSGYKTARIQSEERLELARAVAALLIQLVGRRAAPSESFFLQQLQFFSQNCAHAVLRQIDPSSADP